MIQGASVISPGAQTSVKSNMSTCEFAWPLDLINRGSFITITTIIISTTWIFFFVVLFFFFGMIDEEEENWMGTSHLVSLYWMACCWLCSWKARRIYIFTPKLVSAAANTLVVKVASKASDVRDSHSISQSWSRWSGDLLPAKVLQKMLLIHSVEVESLASYTTPAGTITKRQTGKKKKGFPQFSSCCHRWKQFRTQSAPSCSPDNVHSTIPEEVIVEPAPLRSERWRGELQDRLKISGRSSLKSASNYGDSRMTSGIENTACQCVGKTGGRHQRAHRLCEPACAWKLEIRWLLTLKKKKKKTLPVKRFCQEHMLFSAAWRCWSWQGLSNFPE